MAKATLRSENWRLDLGLAWRPGSATCQIKGEDDAVNTFPFSGCSLHKGCAHNRNV